MKFSNHSDKPSVAIIYDWLLYQHGGAEAVLKAVLESFPEATIFTSIYDPQTAKWANQRRVVTTYLQQVPLFRKLYQPLAIFIPAALESLDLRGYEIVISITGADAKGVITHPDQVHITYLFTPTRYLYLDHDSYFSSSKLLKLPGLKWLAQKYLDYLRWWDQIAALRSDYLLPISQVVAKRIEDIYHRNPEPVIYPPTNIDQVKPDNNLKKSLPEEYYLVVSRLVKHKKHHLSVQASLANKKNLIIVGNGRDKQYLVKQAGATAYQRSPNQTAVQALQTARDQNKSVIFLNHCSQEELVSLYQKAKAVLIPGHEDYCIAGMEAALQGTPSIIYHKTGVAEVLRDEKEAVHLKSQSLADLKKAFSKLQKLEFDQKKLQKRAKQFNRDSFKRTFTKTVFSLYNKYHQSP